jgi:hypothetical protein
MLGSCLAHLNERAELCRQIAEHGDIDGRYRAALMAAAAQAREHAETICAILESEWLQPGQFREDSAA